MGELFRDSFAHYHTDDYEITIQLIKTPVTEYFHIIDFGVDQDILDLAMFDFWLDGTDGTEDNAWFDEADKELFEQYLASVPDDLVSCPLWAMEANEKSDAERKPTQSPDDILFEPVQLDRDKKPEPPPVYDDYGYDG